MLHRALIALLVASAALPLQAQALTVTSPAAGNTVVTRAGDDYATQVLAAPWDFQSPGQLPDAPSSDLTGIAVAGGMFAADTTGNDSQFYVLWPGYVGAVPMDDGALFPIDTGHYRYLTMKVRMTAASGPPLTQSQPARIYFLIDSSFVPHVSFGNSAGFSVTPNQWQIAQFDMQDSPSTLGWTDSAVIRGLRIDPTNKSGVHVEIDWVHLSAPMDDPSQAFQVTWTDAGSGPYTVTAVDADGAGLVLGSGINANQYLADLSMLPPGSYAIEVSRAGAKDTSPGQVTINHPPLISPLQPDVRGDTARNFALDVVGNPWGPMQPADVKLTTGLGNISYPSGHMTARPTSNDPAVSFDLGGQDIPTSLYRSLCFTLQVHGPVDVRHGSVARLFWGTTGSLVTGDDIVLHAGLNEYCFADLDDMPTGANGVTGLWDPTVSVTVSVLRLDPHEFPVSAACNNNPSPANCHDIRIDSLVLSPLDSADPVYAFHWQLHDSDGSPVTVYQYLDSDRVANGNETLAAVGSAANGNGSGASTFVATTGNVAPGVYNVLMVADDGINSVAQYAAGQLKVVSTVPDPIFVNGFD